LGGKDLQGRNNCSKILGVWEKAAASKK
jgi:hypothetical protein